jgi:hypothetical protein
VLRVLRVLGSIPSEKKVNSVRECVVLGRKSTRATRATRAGPKNISIFSACLAMVFTGTAPAAAGRRGKLKTEHPARNKDLR